MKTVDMFHTPVSRLYLHYLLPTLIAMLSSSMYCLADVYFISKGAGSTGLAALNIAMPLFSLFAAVGLCFGVGGATIMAIGEGNHQSTLRNRAFSLCVFAMVVIGMLCSIFGVIFADQIAYLFGSSKELLPYVRQYMIPIIGASIIFIPMYSTSILMRADHAPKTAMKITLLGNMTNIVLDYLFVIVWDMGLSGAAIATCIGSSLVILGVIPHFLRKKNTVHFTKDIFDSALFKRILRNGFGSGIMEISTACIVVVFNIVIMQFADEMFLAAFAIITNIAYVCRGLLNGFAQASQPILSANYGARQWVRVQRSLTLGFLYCILFAMAVYGMFFLFPQQFAALFANGDEQLTLFAAEGIRLYFISLLFTGPITIIMYYFQSVERGNLSTVIALCKGFLFVLLGLCMLLPTIGLTGIWLTTPFAEGAALLLGVVLLKRTKNCSQGYHTTFQ